MICAVAPVDLPPAYLPASRVVARWDAERSIIRQRLNLIDVAENGALLERCSRREYLGAGLGGADWLHAGVWITVYALAGKSSAA